ncbi:hypothetical protein BLNAU_5375 [Blattamonas nauphoetae]|uniref:non-specific serine/threonine protein kinase n=1 Tax=Blattamonas nauphoetae TaxID=2049346 RepID=A0ABQ9Y758_9EUKA|nr:hypothetical protein BLNAU_5375 [Blattamonas nauphoetae]
MKQIEFLSKFNHQRIGKFEESIDMGDYQAIVRKLRQKSLGQLIAKYVKKQESIPAPLAMVILIDIAEGLQDTRAFLTDIQGPELVDPEGTASKEQAQKMAYRSPELFTGEEENASPASDVWALGVIAYRLLVGTELFGSLDLSRMTKEISKFNESKIPDTIPEDLRNGLVKMLDPDPSNRPTTTQLFKEKLLERMLGPETPLTQLKDMQLATQEAEVRLEMTNAGAEEKLMDLEEEKRQLEKEKRRLEKAIQFEEAAREKAEKLNAELEKRHEERIKRNPQLIQQNNSNGWGGVSSAEANKMKENEEEQLLLKMKMGEDGAELAKTMKENGAAEVEMEDGARVESVENVERGLRSGAVLVGWSYDLLRLPMRRLCERGRRNERRRWVGGYRWLRRQFVRFPADLFFVPHSPNNRRHHTQNSVSRPLLLLPRLFHARLLLQKNNEWKRECRVLWV